MPFEYVALQVMNGLMIGLIYGLMALGLSIIFGIMRIVNFAHGELYMLGGYASYYLTEGWLHLPPLLALPLSMLLVFFVGVFIERSLLRPVYTQRLERAGEYAIIMTFGLSIFLQNGALLLFGRTEKTPAAFLERPINLIGNLTIGGDRVFAAVVAFFFLIVTYLVFKKTWIGRALQATAQSRVGASVVGIHIIHMNALALGIGAALAAAGGALLGPIFLVYPEMGLLPVVKAFVIIVLGGMGSIPGSIIGSVLLGLIESLGAVFIHVSYRDVYGFIILIVVLLIRPAGLFGAIERRV
ncbi:MAG: branched-chain amino acid ABC transporter permease [Nitrospinota bacterium]|nr:MAG: branched-chain amino acid ABC transporter permease [Nitrospinota bacterium]